MSITELDLFTKWTGLTFKVLGVAPTGTGRCDACLRDGLRITKRPNGRYTRCEACFAIRKGYPLGKNQFTLGTGDYAVVDAKKAVFYTSLTLPAGSKITTKPALKGTGFYELVLSLMASPPDQFFLLHFGRPTETRRFRMNGGTTPDLLHVSGDTMFGGRNIASIKIWLVHHLLTKYPAIGNDEWSQIIGAGRDLFADRNDDRAAKSAEIYRSFGAKYPGIFHTLPEVGSVEHRMLELATAT